MPSLRSLRNGAALVALALTAVLSVAQGSGVAVAPAQLQALEGEYTNPEEPDTPISFYVEGGKLIFESESQIPISLDALSPTGFGFYAQRLRVTVRFALDASGSGASAAFSSNPETIYERTGPAVHHVFHNYRRSEVMIPMRDGVKLHAVILKPIDINEPLPILIERTPYGVGETAMAAFFRQRPELARSGYIFVAQDIRGRYKSQGSFVMMRPLTDHSNPENIDESTDAYDTVGWLVKHVAGNNGRVGVLGTSYPGFLAMMAGIDPHPAVKAVSPQAPMIDVWMGDDFFHNGAFRQTYGYDYVLSMESTKEFTGDDYGKDRQDKPVDGYDFFLRNGSFAGDVKRSGSRVLPTWKLFLDHPAYDDAWKARAVEDRLNAVAVPTLSVGGTYDQEDMWGPQQEYARLEPHDTKFENFLVLGPWRHGYWASSSRSLGNLNYGEPIGKEFRARIESPFFAHYLKGDAGFDLKNVASFQTGSNTWNQYAQFPPPQAQSTRLHLAGNGDLSWTPTTSAETRYVSDPADPVPYRARPIQPTYGEGSHWYNWMTEDQRFVAGRKDLAVWTLPVLDHDLTVTGEVEADIFAATTGSDTDLVVKLIDEYPEDDPNPTMRGYQLMTNMEIFRGRYLTGFDKPTALQPGAVNEFRFSLHDVDHVFKARHRVMVEVQSTWFPLYDRNPQTFVNNIMKAVPGDYKAATITVFSGPGRDSAVELHVVSGH